MKLLSKIEDNLALTSVLMNMIEALLFLERYEEAEDPMKKALVFVKLTGDRYLEIETELMNAVLMARTGRESAGEALENAIALHDSMEIEQQSMWLDAALVDYAFLLSESEAGTARAALARAKDELKKRPPSAMGKEVKKRFNRAVDNLEKTGESTG